MNKITILILLNLIITPYIFSQNIAKVCSYTSEGEVLNCDRYTRYKSGPNSSWRNACCEDVPVGDDETCIDDCDLESDPQPYEDDEFTDQAPTFSMPSGNDVWIYKDEEFLDEPLEVSSPEYIFMSSVNYDWINDGTTSGYFGLQIDSNTHAVVNRYAPQFRLKAVSKETNINQKTTLYPNPINAKEALYFRGNSINKL